MLMMLISSAYLVRTGALPEAHREAMTDAPASR